MLTEIDQSLARWLRAAVPLATSDVDLGFDQPQAAWDKDRPSPLVNLFLHSLDKSTASAGVGATLVRSEDGGPLHRVESVPVVAASYVISVWGGGAALQHDLLGRLVSLFADASGIPAEFQSDVLRRANPGPTLQLLSAQEHPLGPVWAGLGVAPRPGIQIVVHSPMTSAIETAVARPPTRLVMGVRHERSGAAYAPRRRRLATPMQERIDAKKRLETTIDDSGRTSGLLVSQPPMDESDNSDG